MIDLSNTTKENDSGFWLYQIPQLLRYSEEPEESLHNSNNIVKWLCKKVLS